MTHPEDLLSRFFGVGTSAITSLALYFFGEDPRIVLTILALIGPLALVLTLVRLGKMETAAFRAFALAFGPLLVGVPMTLLAILRRDVPNGPSWVVVTLMFSWFSDTGGYFAGRAFGKRKLYEAVSPKKTIEGALGGLAGSLIGLAAARLYFLPSISITAGIPLALVAGAFGQIGDLGESLVKRSTGVKDSGAIVPGHGGILDRIDALLFASTVVYLYTLWFHPT
jgi:phosphatidate cytidylyltransferase